MRDTEAKRGSGQRWAWAAAALLVMAGCSRCGKAKTGGAPPELARWLPANAQAAVLVPDLAVVGKKLALLESMKVASFAAQLQGFSNAQEYTGALMRQVGVDLRSPERLAEVGIAAERGAAVALFEDGQGYSVVGVKDEGKFRELVQRLAAQRLGATHVSTREEAGVRLTAYAPKADAPARLTLVVRDGFGFLATGEAAGRLASWVQLPAEQSLAQAGGLKAGLSRLPGERDAVVYGTGAALGVPHAFTATFHLDRDAFRVRFDVPGAASPEVLAALTAVPAQTSLNLLPSDAFAVLRFRGDAQALAPLLASLAGTPTEQVLKEAGLDLRKEVLANVKPGAAAALALAPDVSLARGVPQLDMRRTNPFRFVHFAAIAEAKDPASVSATLAKLPKVAPAIGARIEASELGGQPVFVTRYAQGEGVHFAQVEDKVVLGAPSTRLEQMLARAKAPKDAQGPLQDQALQGALDEGAFAAVLDLKRLADAVRALPSQAWGVGGFAIKATTVRWLDATDELRALTVSLGARDSALQGELALRFEKR